MEKAIRNPAILVFSALLVLTLIVSCGKNNSVIIAGNNWTGLIRTPLVPPLQPPGNPPYMIRETIKFIGGISDLNGDLSKNNFTIDSPSLTITNDKPKSGETWQDIWFGYGDSGVKPDGSREVHIRGRCFLKAKKLNPVHPSGSIEYTLDLIMAADKSFQFVLNVKTTQKGTASDLQVSGKATPPDGVITFFPS